MTRFTKIAAFCTLIALPAAGCAKRIERQDNDTDKAAQTALKDQRELREDVKADVKNGVSDSDVKELAKDVAHVNRATMTFEAKRDLRVAILRSVHALHMTQLAAMRGMPQTLAYTNTGETLINDRLLALATELDLSGKLIEALPMATADEWAAKDDEIAAAMTRVVVAEQDAQVALRDAPRQIATPAT